VHPNGFAHSSRPGESASCRAPPGIELLVAPSTQRLDHGCGLLLPDREPLVGRQLGDRALDLEELVAEATWTSSSRRALVDGGHDPRQSSEDLVEVDAEDSDRSALPCD
jgi:hypothetical protein